MPGQLKIVHFRCVACDEWKDVQTVGVVIEGPRCPKCKKPMREVSLEQGGLRLFKNNKGQN